MSGGSPEPSNAGQTQTVTQVADPWSAQQPYLKAGFQAAQDSILNYTPQYYPGQTVIPYSPETNQAMNITEQRALAGSPLQNASNTQLSNTVGGNYLYGNPGFDAAIKAAMDKQTPNIDSQFELSGRYGSGLNQTAHDQAFADAFASQYGNERTNMMQASMLAPTAVASDYNDASKLAAVGAQKESLQQEQAADQAARWDYGQNVRQQQIQAYMPLIQGNYGGTSTTTSPMPPIYRNQTAGFLGGATGGAQLGNMIFPGAGGIAVGGLLGGLLGGL
jgi:hypothetical protein